MMIKNLFLDYLALFYDPKFYFSKIKDTNLKFWAFVLLAYLFLSFSYLGKSYWQIVRPLKFQLSNLIETNINILLPIHWNKEQFSTDKNISLNTAYPEVLKRDYLPSTFITFFPQNNESSLYESLIVLEKSNIKINNLQSGWTEISYKDLPGFENEFTIDQDNKDDFIKRFKDYFKTQIIYLFSLSTIFLPFLLLAFRFITHVVDIFIIGFIIRFNKIKLNYKQLIKLTALVFIPAETLSLAVSTLYPQVSYWPIFGSTLWAFMMFLVFYKVRGEKSKVENRR